ncbi:hypothetical protein BDA96_02G385900 [Sorghum bicolor]|uniref:Uncharacterized protein n=1 Tax=Sorghum bicolor TaxID=4558 RepID=A0A921UVV0_SORBI|nr:hypothetical protein BDA96_02G385900 [Sorghum bicolor]
MGSLTDRECPCPGRILTDTGSAFAIGAVGGSFFHFVKGLRNAPTGARFTGGLEAVRMNAPRIAITRSRAATAAVHRTRASKKKAQVFGRRDPRPERGRLRWSSLAAFFLSLLLPLQLNSGTREAVFLCILCFVYVEFTNHVASAGRNYGASNPKATTGTSEPPVDTRESQRQAATSSLAARVRVVRHRARARGSVDELPTRNPTNGEVGGALPSRPAPPLAVKQTCCSANRNPCAFFALKGRACPRRYSAQCTTPRYC